MAVADGQTYDYIICGGGTAGCVVARRLAEGSNASILLVEAGGPKGSVPPAAIPAALSQVLGTANDWNIKSEPVHALDGRELHLARGKFMGGSSSVNGTLCIRGFKQDYDDWQVPGWSGDEMFQYMSHAEQFHNKDWFKAAEGHGKNGSVSTAPHDPAPISDLVLDSYQSKGLPLVQDMFTTGEIAQGCGHTVRTIYQGVRTTSADYLKDDQPNLTILDKTHVDKVLLTKVGDQLKAEGVQVKTHDGTSLSFQARQEVILTAGSYCSPAILLRSGIGPGGELSQHGIPQQLDLPVGENLMDHLVVLNFYEVSKPGITNDYLIWHDGARERSIAQYKADRTGFMSQFPFGTFAYARLDERLRDAPLWQQASREAAPGRDALGLTQGQPHVEFWNTECYSPKYMFRDFPSDDKHAFAMATEVFGPRSRGRVSLRSTDPLANPVVDHNYLADPVDMLVFSEACKLANEIAMEGAGTKDIIVGSWPAHLTHHTYKSRDEWVPEIRKRADTCYHPAGTCKMGTDSTAVVDPQLRVKGVQGLRVVDASVFPKLMCGHPCMAVYAVAEKAAAMILASTA
ncbi:MAG: hypothetical protein M1821_007018 [Bathelium mastoideum]|nr:MAG: hypothetical protein M1821_007018 [Bathelium mastoideum]